MAAVNNYARIGVGDEPIEHMLDTTRFRTDCEGAIKRVAQLVLEEFSDSFDEAIVSTCRRIADTPFLTDHEFVAGSYLLDLPVSVITNHSNPLLQRSRTSFFPTKVVILDLTEPHSTYRSEKVAAFAARVRTTTLKVVLVAEDIAHNSICIARGLSSRQPVQASSGGIPAARTVGVEDVPRPIQRRECNYIIAVPSLVLSAASLAAGGTLLYYYNGGYPMEGDEIGCGEGCLLGSVACLIGSVFTSCCFIIDGYRYRED